jgi:hypothetical protein
MDSAELPLDARCSALTTVLALARLTGQSARVSSEFLVAYDYGMGGVWAIVLADSAAEITSRYPEVVIVTDRPGWMNEVRFERLRRDTVDIKVAEDQGIFKGVVADRSK